MRALRSFRVRLGWDLLPRFLRRLIIGMIGGTILLVGIALLVLPGPAFVVIPLGLLVLATEFVWARRLLQRARRMFGSKSPDAIDQVRAEAPRSESELL